MATRLEECLNNTQKIPLVIALASGSKPKYFQYRFTVAGDSSTSGSEKVGYRISRGWVEIKQSGKKQVVVQKFIILQSSEKRARLILDDETDSLSDTGTNSVTATQPMGLLLKFSSLNKCWTAESTCRGMQSFFHYSKFGSGFGLSADLTQLWYTCVVRLELYPNEMRMRLTCRGPCGLVLGKSESIDPEDFREPQDKLPFFPAHPASEAK